MVKSLEKFENGCISMYRVARVVI